ncbi:MAG: Conjugal transfer protein TrbG/VirB9/CagX [Rhizorhabdus sp.]|nr:Conjugal transfer protein TrbG/VirB9/CagX [Rhizorhabdus sp.]
MRTGILALVVVATAAIGQDGNGLAEDPRIQVVRFVQDHPIAIAISPASDMLIMLPPGDRIQRITLGISGEYQVRPSAAADGIALRHLRGVAPTMMAVETDQHHYDFALTPTADANAPSLVRVELSRSLMAARPAPPRHGDLTPYKMTGTVALRPQSIGDDGLRTYIEWGDSQLIPAVFAIDAVGREQMVDGYMRGGVFTIDRVYEKLVFRIDRSTVTAIRQEKGARSHGR